MYVRYKQRALSSAEACWFLSGIHKGEGNRKEGRTVNWENCLTRFVGGFFQENTPLHVIFKTDHSLYCD